VDGPLFERVTGLRVEDFKLLNQIGVFNPIHMNAAIYQFNAFEDASLEYAEKPGTHPAECPIGLWDTVLQPRPVHRGRAVYSQLTGLDDAAV